jgi:hypothetical protein
MEGYIMESMIDNLINGNIKDAKRQAKRFKFEKITAYLLDLDYSTASAYATAGFLKGLAGFQVYCDTL